MTTITPKLSLDDFLALPDHDRYELIDGELVALAETTPLHAFIAARIARSVGNFLEEHHLGIALGESCCYRLMLSDGREAVRRADASFIATRDPMAIMSQMVIAGAPDLVVEVVSQHDRYSEVRDKVECWLANGAKLVWVVDHNQRVDVYRPGQDTTTLTADDELTGDDVLPGFACRVADLYAPSRPPA